MFEMTGKLFLISGESYLKGVEAYPSHHQVIRQKVGAPWTGHQSITGPNKQAQAFRKPACEQGEHANCTWKDPRWQKL